MTYSLQPSESPPFAYAGTSRALHVLKCKVNTCDSRHTERELKYAMNRLAMVEDQTGKKWTPAIVGFRRGVNTLWVTRRLKLTLAENQLQNEIWKIFQEGVSVPSTTTRQDFGYRGTVEIAEFIMSLARDIAKMTVYFCWVVVTLIKYLN